MKTPAEISGAIRERVLMISQRNLHGFSDHAVANFQDADRTLELLDELDQMLLGDQLTASIAMVKR